ncbi:MAG: type II secretion system protein GspE [Firmicutes bacterium HGW-Firmicutes-2]|nr:MAG: type II secretion system protein GspE [Firmicutes bacterium HGW-Firmicutes-2]
MRNFKKKLRIGDLLLQYGIITEEQLQTALSHQKSDGGKIGETLISLGYVTKQNINEVLEYQLGIPYVDLTEYNIDKDATGVITETLARRHLLIPIKITKTELYVAMEDPLNIFAIDDVRIFSGKDIIPMLATEEQVLKAIDLHYGKEQANQAAEQYKAEHSAEVDQGLQELEGASDSAVKNAPIVKLVNTILEQGVHNRASDVHIEPYEKRIRVRYRIDGNLKQLFEYETSLLSAIVARIKIMGGMDIAEKRKPQDGRISITVDRLEYDIRVSSLPTTYGEKVVMRINSKEGFNKGKSELGLFKDDLEKFENILSNPYGIILVTGPTGSGKSTTLYTALNEINDEEINIVTVEDPVESQIQGINQVQVNVKAGLSFASALRSILRQDPDVIMIGEIRDGETAEIAVKASVTGHLVVSTLHTNDAPSSITRLMDMGIEPFLIGASVVGVIAQRLVRRLCPKCRSKSQATEFEKSIINTPVEEDLQLYKAVGCHVCNHTGYMGRIGVYEIMPVGHEIRDIINKRGNADDIRRVAMNAGMRTLKFNATRLVMDGITTVDELLRIAYGTD